MLLQYCSDLHLEFPENRNWLNKNALQPMAPVLVLAGDIIPFQELATQKDFFDQLADSFEMVYWLPGNHEYYHGNIVERSGSFCEKIRENVWLVNNRVISYRGVRLVFSTLWSKISLEKEWKIERSLSDFQVISNNDRFFSVGDVNRLHDDSLSFLQNELGKDAVAKTVVVTHHVPTYHHYPPKYKANELNEAFATELYDFIEKSGARAWIYGHVHHNTDDFLIGDTLMTTNQLGYVKVGGHKDFNCGKVLDI